MIPDWQFAVMFMLLGAAAAGLLLRPVKRTRCADCGTPQPDEGTLHEDGCPAHRQDTCLVCQHDNDCQGCIVCHRDMDDLEEGRETT